MEVGLLTTTTSPQKKKPKSSPPSSTRWMPDSSLQPRRLTKSANTPHRVHLGGTRITHYNDGARHNLKQSLRSHWATARPLPDKRPHAVAFRSSTANGIEIQRHFTPIVSGILVGIDNLVGELFSIRHINRLKMTELTPKQVPRSKSLQNTALS